MSNTNYDVELSISYSNAYRHYIPTYAVAVPAWNQYTAWRDEYYKWYETFISFDDGSEEELNYYFDDYYDPSPPVYTDNPRVFVGKSGQYSRDRVNITASGTFSKIYFRNPKRNVLSFNTSNCYVKVNYTSKAQFEVKLNSSGYIASTNASFKCSTVEKACPVQYSWTAAKVYYKKSSESTYNYVNGTVTGSWSDVTVNTNLSLATGYTYNIYIVATADDGTTASTEVGNFATTDGTAVARCVSPVGTYTNGTINFIWSHATEYGTPQYAYDLQYSSNNGGSWTTVSSHVVTTATNKTVTINSAGAYIWRVRTYNTLNQAGDWAQASFINSLPANPPTNVQVTTTGRPTVAWTSTTQSAYQVQMLQNNNVIYDSGALYAGQNTHFINRYMDDTRAYTVRVRVYDSLGNVSNWTSTGYQQSQINDVDFVITQLTDGGARIEVLPNTTFIRYYLQRDGILVGQFDGNYYDDKFAVGLTNYSVVAVTDYDYSDIQTKGFRVEYPRASIVTLAGAQYTVNKRVDNAYEIQTTNEADVNKVNFIGDSRPTHYFNKTKLKSFGITFFDDNAIAEDLLGTVVFYADNFGNGGYCFVTSYSKTDNFVKNSQGVYANEVELTLESTNYDDSIEYPV